MEGALRYHHARVDLSEENNTHTQLILLTGTDKKVLEAGPATGYLSEVMRERGCRVTGVEIDPEAAAVAAQFCERMIVGSIEDIDFAETFAGERFDVVMYGDVLEHLVDPGRVLRETREILAPGGYVVISVPNMSHGSVRLSLLRGDFEYTDTGLLDRTHLRFFTRATLAQLLEDSGYEVSEWRETVSDAFGTELGLREDDFPADIVEAIRADPDARVYQYIVAAHPAGQSAGHAGVSNSRDAIDMLRGNKARTDAIVAEMVAQIAEKDGALAERDAWLSEQDTKLAYMWNELSGIRGSLGYRLLSAYRRVMRWLFPPKSIRGMPYRAARKVLSLSIRSAGVIRREGLRSFLRKAPRKAVRYLRRGSRMPKSDYAYPALDMKIRPLAFPKVAEPKVSIIIPVYNKAVYTFNCLKAVLANSGDVPYEVIVVDDGSTDETPSMLASMQNLRAVTNEQNMGFLRTCNRGMKEARGEYVLLLNNDTYVRPGWLEALVSAIESDQAIGIAGGKLIYPNGKLQEAGGIVFSDGSSFAYGRDDDPAKPEYNYVRDIDYATGACALIRREVIEKTGGFDERFAPAYYEDTDLSLQARQLGYRVVYQPKCEVMHREGTSSEGGSSERLQRENRPKFLDKWRAVLEKEHQRPGTAPFAARERFTGKRVMVIDYHVPEYDRGGGEFRMVSMLRLMKESGHAVTLLPADLQPREPYTREIQQMGIEVLYGTVDLAAIGSFYDVVIVSRPEVAQHYMPLIRRHAPQAVLVYDTVDLHWVREARRAEVENSDAVRRESERLKEMELAAARGCDVTLVVSPVEKEMLEEELPAVKVEVLPNIHPVEGCRVPFSERRDLLFVGFYPHLPNRDAMLYFLREIFPLIKKDLPGVKINIVGPEPGRELESQKSSDVNVTGWVKDLEPYLDNCRVFVSPLRYGAGIKGKNGQSMGFGLPVVTTTMGAEGMGLTDGEECFITDDPAQFVARVVELYRDEALWTRMSASGLRYVEEAYSPDVVRAKLDALVSDATGGVVGRGTAQCNICGSRAGFVPNGGHHKEGFNCLSCNAISRDRMLVAALGMCIGRAGPVTQWQPDPSLVILETSGFRAHPDALGKRFHHVNMLFEGKKHPSVLADVQQMPFADSSADVFLSAEVFEHVRDDEKGFKEVFRVLKPGGFFILQVPSVGEGGQSWTLVDASGEVDVHLVPPQYHAGHSLVYRYYGDDLVERLSRPGLSVMLYKTELPGNLIKEQAVVIVQKSERFSLGSKPA